MYQPQLPKTATDPAQGDAGRTRASGQGSSKDLRIPSLSLLHDLWEHAGANPVFQTQLQSRYGGKLCSS